MATVTLTVGTGTQQWTPTGDQVGCTITKIELWGPGGSGAHRPNRVTGGGAGAYNPITVSIVVTTLLVSGSVPYQTGRGGAAKVDATVVGDPGSAKTWFSAIGTYAADFGLGGLGATTGTVAGGAGGLVANCVPTTNAVAGGNGGTVNIFTGASAGGASGSSAGAGVDGAAITTGVAGGTTTAPAGGGNGGAATITAVDAASGASPGGGGGAANWTTTGGIHSGAGGDGRIIITYTPAAAAATVLLRTALLGPILAQ